MKTDQEIFTTVVVHLLKQNEKSVNDTSGACVYDNDAGLKCAVGCLIDPSQYSENMEHQNIEDLIQGDFHNEMRISGLGTQHIRLLDKLQIIHDSYHPSEWAYRLRELGEEFGLTLPKIKGENFINPQSQDTMS